MKADRLVDAWLNLQRNWWAHKALEELIRENPSEGLKAPALGTKGRSAVTFDPQNALEQSLMKAAADPAHRPQFYKDLAAGDIFIIQHGVPPPKSEGMRTLETGMTIQIQNLEYKGKPHIPIFSSLPRLRAVLKGEASYLAMKTMDFLQMTKGSALILNPGSDYGKEITAEEAASILDGSIWKPTETYVAHKEVQVMIGQPKNYPTELAEALSRFFKQKREVKRAWLAHFFNPERDQKPHTLIAIESTGDFEAISNEAGLVSRGISVPDPPVDFMPITGRGGLEDYFLKGSKPFYERRLFGLF